MHLTIPDDNSVHPKTSPIALGCSASIFDTPDGTKRWADLEAALVDLRGQDLPRLTIDCQTRVIAVRVLRDLLSGTILPQLHGQRRQVTVRVSDRDIVLNTTIRPEDIRSAPSYLWYHSGSVPLDTAQCVEWLLRKGEKEKEAYLQDLAAAKAARASATTVATRSEMDEGVMDGPHSCPRAEMLEDKVHDDDAVTGRVGL